MSNQPHNTVESRRQLISSKSIPIVILVLVVTIFVINQYLLTSFHNWRVKHETAKVVELEQAIDYEQIINTNQLPSETIVLNRIESQPQLNETQEFLQYTAGVDFEPGLYTFIAFSSEHLAYSIDLSIATQASDYPQVNYRTLHSIDDLKLVNLQFESGDRLNITEDSQIPIGLLLVPQTNQISFDQSDYQFGVYTANDSINPGSYFITNGYLCNQGTIDYDQCQVVDDDSSFRINPGQRLYVYEKASQEESNV